MARLKKTVELIKRTGLSRAELAQTLGISRPNIDLWVFNNQIPRKHLPNIERLGKSGAKNIGSLRTSVKPEILLKDLPNELLLGELARRMKRKPGPKTVRA